MPAHSPDAEVDGAVVRPATLPGWAIWDRPLRHNAAFTADNAAVDASPNEPGAVSAWSSVLELREDHTDYLGHVTAAVHLHLFEAARTAWLAEVMDDPAPSFVLARQELDYRRELRLPDGPVTVAIEVLRLTRSTVTVHEVMTSRAGLLHTESHAVLVRWDRDRRRSTPFLEHERRRIKARWPREHNGSTRSSEPVTGPHLE